MDLSLSPAELEFRDEVRAWLADAPPRPHAARATTPRFAFRRAWQRTLNERGWAGLSWPERYGGAGATQIEQAIFYEEVARAGAPQMANTLGLAMGGPTVIAHGTEEQKERYLAPILSAEEIWCQGFSEPAVGLRPRLAEDPRRARRRRLGRHRPEGLDDATPTSRSGACSLARTDADAAKHRGLTYFLMDMEQDGVEVRPLRQITGEAEFNELFIEDARVPHENVSAGRTTAGPWPSRRSCTSAPGSPSRSRSTSTSRCAS